MLISNLTNKRTPDILECIANLSSDEVFTTPQLANKILDLLPDEVWSNPDLRFLDPGCKTGIFLRESAKRLMTGLVEIIPDEDKRREHIFKNMLYGMAITEITSLMSRRTLYYSKSGVSKNSVVDFTESDGNITYKNIKHKFGSNNKCVYCGSPKKLDRGDDLENHAYQFIHQEEASKMKFDVIIGNPPYQLNDGGGGAGSSAMPIYQKFVETAMDLNPRYLSMIIPSRWFAGGKGLDEFRSKMLSDKRLKVLVDHPNAEDCFPGVRVIGGVCYFLWDVKHHGECEVISIIGGEEINRATRNLDEHDTFIRLNEAIPIINKIRSKNETTLDKKVSSRRPFGLAADYDLYDKKEFENAVKVYARGEIGFMHNDKVLTHKDWVDKYKVLISKAYGEEYDYPHHIIGKPILASPGSCCTETYLVVDVFDDKEKAINMEKYIKTRFFRFLLSLKKNTQNISKSIFSFVPDLDMSVEWTDEKLFQRYEITSEEQKFIESIVRETK